MLVRLGNLSATAPPAPSQATLLDFATSRAVYDYRVRGGCGATTTDDLGWFIPEEAEQNGHCDCCDDTPTKNPNHRQITPPEAMRAFNSIGTPPRVQRIRGRDTAQIPQSTHQRRRSRDAHLPMARLEDLRCPCHCDGDRGTETGADEEETDVTGPGAGGRGEGGGEETGNLDEDSGSEEVGAETVEAVREGCYEEDCYEVHLDLLAEFHRGVERETGRRTIQMGAKSKLTVMGEKPGLMPAMMTDP